MGFEQSMTLALIGTALVIVSIAWQFKDEESNWWGLAFRTVLYVFALGFLYDGYWCTNRST